MRSFSVCGGDPDTGKESSNLVSYMVLETIGCLRLHFETPFKQLQINVAFYTIFGIIWMQYSFKVALYESNY